MQVVKFFRIVSVQLNESLTFPRMQYTIICFRVNDKVTEISVKHLSDDEKVDTNGVGVASWLKKMFDELSFSKT